jgi:probable phosphoglycerate mutase
MNKDDENKRVVRVLLIRHARTTHNALGIIQGQLDTEINEDGEEEIKSLRANVMKMMTSKNSSINRVKNIRKVVTSDLQRCLHTAQGMMIDASQMIEESSKLRERHVGVLQGCPRKTAPMEFPRAWATFCESKTKRGLRCAGEGGESVDDVLRRVRECIEDAVRSVLEEEEVEEEEESSGDATIAVVTHAGVLLLLREYLVDEDLSGEKNRGIVRNCSIGTMRVEVDTSSSESKSTTRWILDSWGKVDAEGTADVL